MAIIRLSILLLVLGAMAWPLGTLADKRIASTERRGRHPLLENITDVKPLIQYPLPWGKGIRLMLQPPHKCSLLRGNKEGYLLYEISRSIGPVHCFESDSRLTIDMIEFWFQRSFDIFAEPIILTGRSFWITNPITFLYPHMKNNLHLVVKKILPQRQSVMQAFTPATWVATFVGVAVFWLALRLADRRNTPLDALNTFLFGSFIESRHPIPNFISLTFSIFNVIMITAFCSKLMTFLVVMKEPPQPQTLEEAEARVTRMYFTLEGVHPFGRDDVLYKLYMKSVPYKTWGEVLNDVVASTESAYLGSESTQDDLVYNSYYIKTTTGRVLTYSLHMVPESVLNPSFPAYHVPQMWPHTERFSALLQRAVEAGIRTKVLRYVGAYRVKKGWNMRDIPPSDDPEPFTMANMLEAFVVLGAGTAISIAAFAGELSFGKWRRWPKACILYLNSKRA